LGAPWKDRRIPSASLGTREIAPGAREYVISVEYQPYADLSGDPLIAARQDAACAAAWRRLTENPTPTDIARRYLDRAARYVTLAATMLGEQEAARGKSRFEREPKSSPASGSIGRKATAIEREHFVDSQCLGQQDERRIRVIHRSV
jgi:hypothetical protein